MNWITKLAALALVIMLVAWPAGALVSCLATPSQAHCSQCPTASRSMAAHVQAATAPAPCCQISSGKTAPRSELQAPVSGVLALIQPKTVVSISAPTTPGRTEAAETIPLTDRSPHQALLCTFLI